MKTFLKIVGGIALLVVGLAAGALTWLNFKKPAARAASAEKIEVTPERLARGRYVVEHVSDCLGCHSDHLLTSFSMPVKPGSEGEGGYMFDEKFGIPGRVAAQNITPDEQYGLGKWTDGEILRAIREGVDRNGDALFPMMPYQHLRHMSDDDAKAVVAYLRTLKPVHKGVPEKKLNFPLNFIVKFVPEPLDAPVAHPDANDSVAYGHYLTTIGGCRECHTPHDEHNALIAGKDFSGGWEMNGPWGRNYTANLTPMPYTFVGRATKAEFIGRFKACASMTAETAPKPAAGRNTVMPWIAFAGMTEQDLGAIYDYLRTVKPIDNKVNTFPDGK
jgi:mono/diheme cytochrome c family protein